MINFFCQAFLDLFFGSLGDIKFFISREMFVNFLKRLKYILILIEKKDSISFVSIKLHDVQQRCKR